MESQQPVADARRRDSRLCPAELPLAGYLKKADSLVYICYLPAMPCVSKCYYLLRHSLTFLAIKTIHSIRRCFWCPVSTIFQIALKLFQSLRLCHPTRFEPFCQLSVTLSHQFSYFKAINMDMKSPVLVRMRLRDTFPEAGRLHEAFLVGIGDRQIIDRRYRAPSREFLHRRHEALGSGI